MSIEREGKLIVFVCDECGDQLETGAEDFAEALERMREANWTYRKDDVGQWEHYCSVCKPFRRKRS